MKRQLDLARALAGETFQMGDANVHVDAWCSEPDDLLVYRMSSDAPIDVNISVSGTFLKQSRASLETVSDGHRATLIVMGRMPGLNIGLLPHPSENPWEDEQDGTGMAYAGAFSLTVTGGDINVGDNSLQCSNITGLSLRFRSMSGFKGSDQQPERSMTVIADHLEKTIDEWSTDLQTMLDRHIADYRRYFDRVAIHLGSAMLMMRNYCSRRSFARMRTKNRIVWRCWQRQCSISAGICLSPHPGHTPTGESAGDLES